MRLTQIEKKAKSVGINNTWKYSRKELIRHIQRVEGNFPCFATAKNHCDQHACLWRPDCIRS
ncbi:MAG: SAP domain-containing protein [Candidatus Omnitrophica bacterium]|nr:SAP domain-containing protein [Candidatus Omnitrophota bacterium]